MLAWDFPGLWSMSNKWRKAGTGSILGQGTSQSKLRRILHGRVVLKSGISPGLKKDSPTKGSQVCPRVAMIGIPSLELRETMKYIHLKRDHLVGSAENFMEEGVWGALTLVKVVANRVTWWRIVHIWEVEKKRKEKVQPDGPSEKAPMRIEPTTSWIDERVTRKIKEKNKCGERGLNSQPLA